MRAIFCVDPGKSTGVAWGILNEAERNGLAIDAVAKRIFSGSTTITASEPEQIRLLNKLWVEFKRRSVQKNLLTPEQIDLVVEDFVLFPGEKPGKDTTVAERIAWGFEGYRMANFDRHRPHANPPMRHYTSITWQKSGAASRFAQKDILTRADAWIVGKQHERSAFAHMILRTNVLMDNRKPHT